jgi:hypothetical protein
VSGLSERPTASRNDHAVPAVIVEQIVQLAMSPPPAGRGRWTTRLLAKEVGLTSGCVSDVLRRNDLKPHLVRTYKMSRDPDFVAKVTDVVGLYLNPPEHAVVLVSTSRPRSRRCSDRSSRCLCAKGGPHATRTTTNATASSICTPHRRLPRAA